MVRRALTLMLIAGALGACRESNDPTGPAVDTKGVASVELLGPASPWQMSWPNSVAYYTAIVRDTAGVEIQGITIVWSSSDSLRLSIAPEQGDSRKAMATILGVGEVTVTAEFGGKTAQATVVGHVPSIFQLGVWPDTSVILVGQERGLRTQLKKGEIVPSTVYGADWSSSNPAIARVDRLGNVLGVSDGQAKITAVVSGRSFSADVFVSRYPAPLRFTTVAVGQSHACALTAQGEAYCWGYNGHGELGSDAVMDRCVPRTYYDVATAQRCSEAPVRVNTTLRFAAISAGGPLTCGLTAAGAAYCWGQRPPGPPENGVTAPATPTAIPGNVVFRTLDVDGYQVCGVSTSDIAYCWGKNITGSLGNGSFSTQNMTPGTVNGGLRWSLVNTGSGTTCGITTDSLAYCWGANKFGQAAGAPGDPGRSGCSDNARNCLVTPERVSLTKFIDVQSTGTRTCGLTSSQDVFCWGNFLSGFTKVLGNVKFKEVELSGQHCGLAIDAMSYCWVMDGIGAPVAVRDLPSFRQRQSVQGGGMACTIDEPGVAWCWERGTPAESNAESFFRRQLPTRIPGQD